jgi:Ca2+-binding RTX toxin-like protein
MIYENTNDSVASYTHSGFANSGFISPGSGGLDLAQVMNVSFGTLADDQGDLLIGTLGNGVLRYNGQTGAFVGTLIPSVVNGEQLLPAGIDFLLFSNEADLYVSNFLPNGDIYRFDFNTGAFVGVFVNGTNGDQHGPIKWTSFADGTTGLLAIVANQDIVRRYSNTGAVVGTFAQVPDIHSMVIVGTTLYVTSQSLDAIFRFDSRTGASQGWLVPPGGDGHLDGPTFIAANSAGDIAVVSNNTNQILRYDPETSSFLGVAAQGGTFTLGDIGPFVFKDDRRNGPIVNMSGVTISNGFLSEGHTAGMRVAGGASVLLTDCTVRDHESRQFGGGIGNFGLLELRRCAVTGNTLPPGLGGQTSRGGGIMNGEGILRVYDTLIANNFGGKGGGIFNFGTLELINATVSNNRSHGEGGGIGNIGRADISFSTISANRTNESGGGEPRPFGGGIWNDFEGVMHAGNTVIAGNTDNRSPGQANYSPDCYSPLQFGFVSERDNVVGIMDTANCDFEDVQGGTAGSIQFGTPGAPLAVGLGPLASNGGPTQTHLPQPGSLLIDGDQAVTSSTFYDCGQATLGFNVDHDQRLQPRHLDGNSDGDDECDIGAVEVRPVSALDLDADGIENSVDAAPSVFSMAFLDVSGGSSTNGFIVSTGQQFLTITNAVNGGVTVTAAAGGGAQPAIISACGGEVTVQVAAGQTITITCVTANAGPDQIVECVSGGTTPVTLNGSASSAAGGPPTFQWSVPGVVLQNANQAIASGGFPLGTKTATLTVTRGAAVATDTALVTVLDTKAPVLLQPPDVVAATCTSVSLGQAVATDTCGGPVTIVNNAPASFRAGVHTITWRAIDQFGNEAVKTQRVTVGLGDNSACCPVGTNIINGTSNNNTLNGTAGADCILGRGAQDTINGLGGNDFISGGDGNDVIDGGSGNDFVEGGTGQDTVRGGTGNDTVLGGDGDDLCFGGDNDDTVRGGQGQDRLFGENGNDSLFGDIGDDILDGGAGNDSLNGGGLHDQCTGGPGTNTFFMCQNQPNSFGPLTASFAVTGDWGTGFCVGLSARNPTANLAQSWGVTFELTNATIYTSWNGLYGGATGTVTVLPSMSWNQTLDPGETDATIGFCANRTVSGSPPPTVLNTQATF